MLTLLLKDYGTVCSTRTLYSLCLINVQLLPARQRECRYLRLASFEKTMRGYGNISQWSTEGRKWWHRFCWRKSGHSDRSSYVPAAEVLSLAHAQLASSGYWTTSLISDLRPGYGKGSISSSEPRGKLVCVPRPGSEKDSHASQFEGIGEHVGRSGHWCILLG